jgi:alcohol dehydrogenase YqhD (iron-dependent ADH family)
VPHGGGLSVVYPAWLKHHKEVLKDKLEFLFERTPHPELGGNNFIERLEDFFSIIKTPIRLKEYGIAADQFDKIANCLAENHARGVYYDLKTEDHYAMLELMA